MKQFLFLKRAVSSILILSLIVVQTAYGQPGKNIDWANDTISSTNARNAQFKFRSEWSGAGKKATSSVTLPVNKLKDIMDACAAKGIGAVQFLIVMVRAEDIDHYAKHRPGMTSDERADMIGRQILVVKVPRAAFFQEGSGFNKPISGNNPLMLSLLGAGLLQFEMSKDVSNTLSDDDLYFSFGQICPPPSSCDN